MNIEIHGKRWFQAYYGSVRLFGDSPISNAIRATSSVIDVPRKRDL